MSDNMSSAMIGLLSQCTRCLVRSTSTTSTASWSYSPKQRPCSSKVAGPSSRQVNNSASLLSCINSELPSARRQGVRPNTLTIITDDLSVRQLRRLSNNRSSASSSGMRVFSTAIGMWEVRVGASSKIRMVHSQLRRVAARLKADLSLTLERVSRQIIRLSREGQAKDQASRLMDLYLLRAFFGTQLWLHDQGAGTQPTRDGTTRKRRPWFEVAAISFVEPYISACPGSKAAAKLGRRVVAEMGMAGGGDEEVELALVNDVLLQVVSPFSGPAG